MSKKFTSKSSQNYSDDNEYYYDEIGEDPNVKTFDAQMNILRYRSPYLRRNLALYKKNNDNVLTHTKLPNISTENFQIILKYIYDGILSLNEKDNSEIFKVLFAADEPHLDYLQKHMVKNKSEWMEQRFEFIHRTSFQSNSLLELQQFCTNLVAISLVKIFLESLDSTSLPIKRNDLRMREIKIWEHVLKWSLAKNPALLSNPNTWSDDDLMENTLQHCSSSKEFLQKVNSYKKLLKHQPYNDLLNSYLDHDSEPIENILPLKNIKIDGIIDSKIVNLDIVSIISRRIDDHSLEELYLPYKFELLLRGSRDGFTPKKFHELCDGKHNTVTFIKVKGAEEILGGYNPLEWKTFGCGETKDSFIFSFKNNNIKDTIISNVVDSDHALKYGVYRGPYFGYDLNIYSSTSDEFTNYDKIICRKCFYEEKIRDTEEEFLLEDYEVFQVTKR